MSMSIKIKGLDVAIEKLNPKTYVQNMQDALNRFGVRVDHDAKQLAPVDEGHLKGAIYFKPTNGGVQVGCTVDYAAYLEFGTRKFAAVYVATLPSTWQAFAAQFKGPGGGSFEEFVMRLTLWVKRKLIGATYNVQTRKRDRIGKQTAAQTMEADAYAIALHILRNGISPHPFMFPAVENNLPQLYKELGTVK